MKQRHSKILLLVMMIACSIGTRELSAETVPVAFVPVTYFDFHSDKSNPEFNNTFGTFAGVGSRTNLLLPVLDNEGLPAVNPDSITVSDSITIGSKLNIFDGNDKYGFACIGQWYREWQPGRVQTWSKAPSFRIIMVDDSSQPPEPIIGFGDTIWEYPKKPDTILVPVIFHTSDTLFKNVKIVDSLAFRKITSGSFIIPRGPTDETSFEMTNDTIPFAEGLQCTNERFFPIDGKGLTLQEEADGYNGHNGCFTMKFHNRFTYRPGAIVQLTTDDDCWLFVNKRIALEPLGGLHGAKSAVCYLDSLGLVAGQTYDFDIFYAERAWDAGTFTMTTNFCFVDSRDGTMEILGVSNPSAKQQPGFQPERYRLGFNFENNALFISGGRQQRTFNLLGRMVHPVRSGVPAGKITFR